MRLVLAFFIIEGLLGCSNTKHITYSFNSDVVTDSIVALLRDNEPKHGKPIDKLKWFCLIREIRDSDGYELIVNEVVDNNNSPLNIAIKRSNRYLRIGNVLKIPIVFDTDILSINFNALGLRSMNIGGYYFRVVRASKGDYRVEETAVLF